jgi:hypothetical protein
MRRFLPSAHCALHGEIVSGEVVGGGRARGRARISSSPPRLTAWRVANPHLATSPLTISPLNQDRASCNDPHAIHGDVRGGAPDRARRHAVGGACGAHLRRRQRGGARLPHRADAADARGPGQGDRALPGDDRQAVRREPDTAADPDPAQLRRLYRRHRRLRHQDRRDGRPQSGSVPAQIQSRRCQGDPQVHLGAARPLRREGGRGLHLHGRLRMRRPPRRGRHSEPRAAAGRTPSR